LLYSVQPETAIANANKRMIDLFISSAKIGFCGQVTAKESQSSVHKMIIHRSH
jgi:hypothetical protein